MLDGLSKNFDIKVILRITFIFLKYFRTDLGLFGPLKKLSIFSTIFYKFFQVIMIFFAFYFLKTLINWKKSFFGIYTIKIIYLRK